MTRSERQSSLARCLMVAHLRVSRGLSCTLKPWGGRVTCWLLLAVPLRLHTCECSLLPW